MQITKDENGSFSMSGISSDELTQLLIIVNTADCMNCGLLYECRGKDGAVCEKWQKFLRPIVLAELPKENDIPTYHKALVHRGDVPAKEKVEEENKKYEKLSYR